MRILWIVNMVMPELAKHMGVETGTSGTWMIDVSKQLAEDKNNISLAIACVYGRKFKKEVVNGTVYYMLPGNGKNMLFYTAKYEKYWQQINQDFRPDIVHLHGTEYSHGLSFLRACPMVKAVVSMQGVLRRIKDVDFGGLKWWQIITNRTFSENIHLNGMLEMHLMHKKNVKYEYEILNRVKYVNHVNFWDGCMARMINPSLKCFQIEYNLRKEFYLASKWSAAEMKPYTIFTNPGGTPLKGLHVLLQAVAIIKRRYPQVHLCIPGMGGKNGTLRVTSGYTKYIGKLVKKLAIVDNVTFMGRQSGKDMVEHMRRANVVVVPSATESVSLILREAMYLGCPCITSFRGGMTDFITDKEDGYLYDYPEYFCLAERIIQIFEDRNVENMSKKAIEKAMAAHNAQKNYSDYIHMYHAIVNGE